MPNIVGVTPANANSTLAILSLVIGDITYEYSTIFAEGLITSQAPADGTPVNIGTTVNVSVSLGSPAFVPDVVGLTPADANADIAAAGLVDRRGHADPPGPGFNNLLERFKTV